MAKRAAAPPDIAPPALGLRAIPSGVWALGLVSLFMDMSSELIHSLLPVFLVSVLGASMVTVGLIEGMAEATALVTKVFSGVISDRLGKRKALTVLGYGLAALTKPLFALAPTVAWVFTARFADRVGQGIRGAPRDALIGDLTPAHLRGASYGLRQSLDTVGAVLGPLLAIALMALLADDIRSVFWFATLPAVLAVAILVVGVHEPQRPASSGRAPPVRWVEIRRLGAAYWYVVAIGGVFGLARFSEAFLILRAQDVGLGLTLVPLVLIVMSVVYALSAYPAGALSDRIDRRHVLAVGIVVLIAADALLAATTTVWQVMLGVALWGLHLGLTQGLLAALVADTCPAKLRGTGFGLFNLVAGLTMLTASLLAGLLWDHYGAPVTFVTAAGFAAISLIALLFRPRRGRPGSPV